jgi:predicted Zn-dependent protease
LELCPDDYLVLEMKAQALLLELRLIDASRAAQRVVALAPHWAEGFVTLARVHRELGEVALALAAYDEAVRLDSAGVGVDEEVIEERREMRRFVELTEAHVCAVQSQREIQQQSPTSLGPTGDGVAAPIAIPSHIPSHLHDEVLCCMQHLQSRVKVGRREVQS